MNEFEESTNVSVDGSQIVKDSANALVDGSRIVKDLTNVTEVEYNYYNIIVRPVSLRILFYFIETL